MMTIQFRVYGEPKPQGSKKSVPIYSRTGPVMRDGRVLTRVVNDNPKLGQWRQGVAQAARAAAACGKPMMSLFANTKTPARWHSHLDPQSGKTFPDALDVKRWALNDDPSEDGQTWLFTEDDTEDAYACLSQYGLCE